MPTEKDVVTESARKRLANKSGIVETDRADSGLTTLSFQSVAHPNRHIWMDTDLSGEAILDLENWSDDTQWDNSVAHATSDDVSLLTEVAIAWLTGCEIQQCKSVGGSQVDWR